MSALVLAIEAPYWQDVLILAQQKGFEISHAVVQFRDTPAPNHFFDQFKGKQIDGKKFYRIDLMFELIKSEFGQNYPVLDAATIAKFQKYERDFNILTDRFSYFPRPYRYRKRLFRECLRYWLAFFAENKITSAVFGCTPHNLSDYTAFMVARELEIPTFIVAPTTIDDYVLIRNDYRGYVNIPANFMPGASDEELKAAIPEQLYERATEMSRALKYVIQKNDASVGKKNMNAEQAKFDANVAKEKLKSFSSRFRRFVISAPKFKTSLALNGVFPPFVRRAIRLYEIPWQKSQQRMHDKLAITPNLNEKYIYFAMHLQPERTSTPEAEVFEDQFLAIDILAKALPTGWKLYVKENPRQYNKINLLKGHHQRDISDYEQMVKLPNVHLISQKVPSKEIVKNAQVISTLAGTVGWEALQSGKPCIIFANAWYSACESAHRVESVAEAKTAIDACVKSTPEKVRNDLLRFLAYTKNEFNVGSIGTTAYLKGATLPYAEHVEQMAARICKDLQVSVSKVPQRAA